MNNPVDAMILGEKFFQTGDLDEAQKTFEEIIRTDPENHNAMNNLGTVLYTKGDNSSAEKFYLKAFSLKNDDSDILLNLADLYLNLKKWQDAVPYLKYYLKNEPLDCFRLNQLALAFMESGEPDQAMPIMKRSLEIQPDQDSIRDSLKTLEPLDRESSQTPGRSVCPDSSSGLFFKSKAKAHKAMRFSVCLIEPEGSSFSHFLYDTCKYFCFTLESAGYDCCIVKNRTASDRINIIIGGHHLDSPDDVKRIAGAGKYIVMQSELIGKDTINNWPIQTRYSTVYVPLLQQASAVWDGIESNIEPLRKFGIKADAIRFGYLPQLEEVIQKKNKDIDFLYYGSVTPHRKKMLDALISKGGKVFVDFDSTAIYRNDLIARTRVNLAPIQSPEADHLAGSRILYLINNRSIVVVERCRDQDWVEHCFPSADTEQWADLCLETLRRPDLDQITEEYYERFKKINLVDEFHPLIDRLG